MLQSDVSLCLESGHPHQELTQDVLLELLHLLGAQVRMQGVLFLELLHMGLELLLQRGQSLLGLRQPVGAETSRALQGQQRHLDVPQELSRLCHSTGVAAQGPFGLGDIRLKYNKHHFVITQTNPIYRSSHLFEMFLTLFFIVHSNWSQFCCTRL